MTQPDITATFTKQQQAFSRSETKDYEFRRRQLDALEASIRQHIDELNAAFWHDLRKNEFETWTTEIGVTLSSIGYTRRHLRRWMKPRSVRSTLPLFPSHNQIIAEPYGTMLIIGPFNYPFQLVFEPLIGAIAAGNTAVIKPSEMTPRVAAVIDKIIAAAFAPDYVACVQGGVDTTTELLAQRFDYIFFTGSTRVGSIVMQAAAKNLTPVTLELGGKSPAIITASADIKTATRHIAWGKFLNTGQTCVAPDYALVDDTIYDQFAAELRRAITEFYGSNPAESPDYGRIVSDAHWQRLTSLLTEHKEAIVIGGESDQKQRYLAPTVVGDVTWRQPLMQSEIFGPILPLIRYDATQFDQQVIAPIAERDKPLALYLFTHDDTTRRQVLGQLSFGGGFINGTILQLANPRLPFGGVGASGIGAYHGQTSFDEFSHHKSVVRWRAGHSLPALLPPYKGKLDFVKRLQR